MNAYIQQPIDNIKLAVQDYLFTRKCHARYIRGIVDHHRYLRLHDHYIWPPHTMVSYPLCRAISLTPGCYAHYVENTHVRVLRSLCRTHSRQSATLTMQNTLTSECYTHYVEHTHVRVLHSLCRTYSRQSATLTMQNTLTSECYAHYSGPPHIKVACLRYRTISHQSVMLTTYVHIHKCTN